MDEQEKELEEILRTFDKAPLPSSERNNQAQWQNTDAEHYVTTGDILTYLYAM